LTASRDREVLMSVVTHAVLRVDEGGSSYFEDRQVELEPAEFVPGIPLVDLGAPVPVSSLTLCRCDANYVSDWHPPPRPQFVVVLEGGFDVTSSAGETRRFEAGAMCLVEDVTGTGHQTRTVGTDPCVFLAVAIGDGA
jgi:hypothetical protein